MKAALIGLVVLFAGGLLWALGEEFGHWVWAVLILPILMSIVN